MRSAPKNQVQVWLNEERFPVEEGYLRSLDVLDVDWQNALINGIKQSHDASVGDFN